MTASTKSQRITKDCQPVFPCWLKVTSGWFKCSDDFHWKWNFPNATHWHPDQPDAPQEVPESTMADAASNPAEAERLANEFAGVKPAPAKETIARKVAQELASDLSPHPLPNIIAAWSKVILRAIDRAGETKGADWKAGELARVVHSPNYVWNGVEVRLIEKHENGVQWKTETTSDLSPTNISYWREENLYREPPASVDAGTPRMDRVAGDPALALAEGRTLERELNEAQADVLRGIKADARHLVESNNTATELAALTAELKDQRGINQLAEAEVVSLTAERDSLAEQLASIAEAEEKSAEGKGGDIGHSSGHTENEKKAFWNGYWGAAHNIAHDIRTALSANPRP